MTITDVQGFQASGVSSGIKSNDELDLAQLLRRPKTSFSGGSFTSNKMTALCLVTRKHLETTGGAAAAVVLNSGNANAATGDQGLLDAEHMCHLTAKGIGCDSSEVLVCSTGWIGYPLQMESDCFGHN